MPSRFTKRKSRVARRSRRRNTRRQPRRRYKGGGDAPQFPPKEIVDLIDHVVYINLDKRTDRREQIEKELSIFPKEKVTRFPAIVEENGNLGATKSHLAAVEMAIKEGWKNVLILEDDSVWTNPEEGFKDFKRLVSQPYDNIVLGAFYPKFDDGTHRLRFSMGASSYLLNKDYMPKMRDAYKKKINDFLGNPGAEKSSVAPNVHNPELQGRDTWYVVYPSLMIQRKGHSDVVGGDVDYEKLFVVETTTSA